MCPVMLITVSTPAAGWFSDPAGRPGSLRWWDGAAWTRYLTDDPDAAAPTDAAITQQSEPDPAPQPTQQPAQGRPGMPPGYDFARPRRRRTRRRPVLSVLVAVVVAAMAFVIVINARTEASSWLQPPPPKASDQTRLITDYQDATRLMTVGPSRDDPVLRVVMPGKPYETARSGMSGYGVFNPGVDSQSVVDDDYDGKGNKWVAMVAGGVVISDLTKKDPQSTAEKVFARMATTGYTGLSVKIKNAKSHGYPGYSDKAWVVTGEIHYSVKHVASSHDVVSVLVVDAGNGRYAGWFTSRPDKSKPTLKSAVEATIKTIQIG